VIDAPGAGVVKSHDGGVVSTSAVVVADGLSSPAPSPLHSARSVIGPSTSVRANRTVPVPSAIALPISCSPSPALPYSSTVQPPRVATEI